MSTNNSSNHLVEYLSFESKQQQQQKSSSDNSNNEDIGHHALDQLLESKLGNEITTIAQRLVAIRNNNNNDNTNGGVIIRSSLLEEEVTKLMSTSTAFQQMSAQINACPLSLLLPSKQSTVNTMMSEENMIIGSNQKSNKSSTANATATAAAAANKPTTAAVTSFSLFDLMDSQKGGGTFTFPPRIMAHQVIDAYQQQQQHDGGGSSNNGDCSQCKNNSHDDTATQSTTNKTTTSSSALELLEQAEDMEDLSPDVESWEHIRSILYLGLTATTTNNNVNGEEEERRRRYFKVHKSLFDKCRRNSGGGGGTMMMFRTQTWGLTFNIVGFILNLSNEFDNQDEQKKILKTDLDLYWDSCRYLLSSLSHLAMEYIASCVGYEKEIERMLLGLSYLLCKDGSACVLAMMEPLAGWFEVWARFIGPSKLLTILRVSGLGEVVLRRCECRGRNEASKRLYEMLLRRHDGSSSSESSPTLEDMENSNFLQSLSMIRVIACRCSVTLENMGSIFCCNAIVSASFFLSADGIVSSDEVQTMLEKTENDETEEDFKEQALSIVMQKEITARVLKPFRDVLLLKESTPGLVDANLEALCTQTISLIEQSC